VNKRTRPGASAAGVTTAVAMMVAALGAGPARAQAHRHAPNDDAWWGADKALHVSASAGLAAAGYGGAAPLTEDRRWRLAAGGGLALAAGLTKEAYDLSGRSDPSARDLTWNVIGTAAGLLLAITVDHLLARWLTTRPAP
jgi:putative lipoprotein